MNKFSEIFKKLRLRENYLQKDLANEFGVSITTVSWWENGKGFPEANKLPEIATFFNVSLDYLFGLEPIKKEQSPELTKREREMLQIFRNADEADQDVIMSVLDHFKKDLPDEQIKNW